MAFHLRGIFFLSSENGQNPPSPFVLGLTYMQAECIDWYRQQGLSIYTRQRYYVTTTSTCITITSYNDQMCLHNYSAPKCYYVDLLTYPQGSVHHLAYNDDTLMYNYHHHIYVLFCWVVTPKPRKNLHYGFNAGGCTTMDMGDDDR